MYCLTWKRSVPIDIASIRRPGKPNLLARFSFGYVRFVYDWILRWCTIFSTGIGKDRSHASQNSSDHHQKAGGDGLSPPVSLVPVQQCLRYRQAAFRNFIEGESKYLVFLSCRSRERLAASDQGQKSAGHLREPGAPFRRRLPSLPRSPISTRSKLSASRHATAPGLFVLS